VITPSRHTARLVTEQLSVPADQVYVCSPGAPTWPTLGAEPRRPTDGYILFVGTLEPRKNVGVLLDAYARLATRSATVPRLVLAGAAVPAADAWLTRLAHPPFSGRVTHLGYVPDAERERLYAGARLLVLPSLDEGFGLPVLEAMAAGVPVVASTRGALPEVVGDAGVLVDALDADALAAAIERLIADAAWAADRARTGLARAGAYTWRAAAIRLREAYVDAVARRCGATPARAGDVAVSGGRA